MLASDIRDAIVGVRPECPVTIEQTGGGCATLYVGSRDDDGRYWLAIGPGSYDWSEPWASAFDAPGDVCICPDDDGQGHVAYPESADDIGRIVASHCQCRRCDAVSAYSHGLCAACIEHGGMRHPADDGTSTGDDA